MRPIATIGPIGVPAVIGPVVEIVIGIDIVLVINGDIVLIDFIATPLRTRAIAKHGMRAAISPQVIAAKVIAATIQATPAPAPEATAAFVRAEEAKWRRVVKEQSISAD